MSEKKKIFISYKRNVEPDEPIALKVFANLLKRHDVVIDQSMLVGTKWAEHIEKQIRMSDYFICFISEYSANSEMVIAEIENAYQLYKQYGKPIILPVRLKYTEPLAYPLSAYLNPINYVLWKNESDTAELIEQLELSIAGKEPSGKKLLKPSGKTKEQIVEPPPLIAPVTSEYLEGTMTSHPRSYITSVDCNDL